MFRSRLAALVLVWVALGCGPGPYKREVYPASLTVLVGGLPVENLEITLYPRKKEDRRVWQLHWPRGLTDKNGLVQLFTFYQDDGAPVGEFNVTVYWPRNDAPTIGKAPDRFRGKYADPQTTPLQVTVRQRSITPDYFNLERPPP